MGENLPYADEVPYFKTGASSPDTWLDKAAVELKRRGGRVNMRAQGTDPMTGGEALMFVFELEGESFKILWPILPVKNEKDKLAARRQAATMIYHDVKAKCITAEVLGARTAFFSFLLLPDKRTVSELSAPELMNGLPDMKKLSAGA